ncbi:hypothetical protein N7462_009979 [Penicillium macrosclerotiorum]|uniref:uncharacterized protein n=1 Tax=Penicillium macrosclerotiorum TaxID=303699 RepID=UPI002547A0F8|nr:uncharacterized protein N7462_009979 [Penicillium macrosclerotiorum]KAJ5668909.1 hypothetical protein N7462_009979 [Penicillium macrosclerotiorum]
MADKICIDADYFTLEQDHAADDWQSDTMSLASQITRGRIENGRRSPSDEQQFEAYETGTFSMSELVKDAGRCNATHFGLIDQIADLISSDAADMYPSAIVRGVDLFPPPVSWTPPNCVFEVDNLLQEWTWSEPFDLVFLRHMLGSFDSEGWSQLYKRCYDNLIPGGWIEQLEFDINIMTDDNSMPADSPLASWGDNFIDCAERAGRSLTVQKTMRTSIENAGFVDVHEQLYKVPIGPWAKDKVLKEAGQLNYHHWVTGLEGYTMWLLTKFGAPTPWSVDEVQVYLAKVRADLKKPSIHGWELGRRIWARKPFAGEEKEELVRPELSP